MNTRHSQTQEFGVTDANQEDAEFQFIPLGAVVEAVVMRLSTDLPRVKVRSVIDVGGGRTTDRC